MAKNAGAIFVDIKANTANFHRGISEAAKSSDGLKGIFKGLSKAAIGIGAGLTAIGGFALSTAADFETMRVALKTTFQGNEQAAKDAEEQIKEFAARTPFDLQQVTNGFIKLNNMGLDPSERALTSYGDTASAMGKSLNDMVEAVADAATGEFERLKEFGIRASSEGENVKFTFRGVTTEVGKNAEEIENYLIGLGETNFSGGMEDQSKTLSGLLSTLKDTFANAMDTIANDSGLLDAAKEAIKGLSDFLTGPFMDAVNGAIEGFHMFTDYLSGKFTEVVDELDKNLNESSDVLSDYSREMLGTGEETSKLSSLFSDQTSVIVQLKDMIVDFLKPAIDEIKETYENELKPAVMANKDLFADLGKILLIIAGIIGTALVFAIKGFMVGINLTMKAVSFAIHIMDAFRDTSQKMRDALSGALDWVIDKFQALIDKIREALDNIRRIKQSISDLGGLGGLVSAVVPGFADGVKNFSGGLAVVGERGPELVNLPKGSDVITNRESKEMMSGPTVNIGNVTVGGDIDLDVFAQRLGNLLRTA